MAKELETYHLLVAVYTIVTFLDMSGGQNSLPYHGLETANCSAALVMYETQLMVVDVGGNTGHGRKGEEQR